MRTEESNVEKAPMMAHALFLVHSQRSLEILENDSYSDLFRTGKMNICVAKYTVFPEGPLILIRRAAKFARGHSPHARLARIPW